MTKITVKQVEQTCTFCPSQWEGTTDDGRRIYARYRDGFLTVQVSPQGKKGIGAALESPCIYDGLVGPRLHGEMDYETLVQFTKYLVIWPEDMKQLEKKGEQ